MENFKRSGAGDGIEEDSDEAKETLG